MILLSRHSKKASSRFLLCSPLPDALSMPLPEFLFDWMRRTVQTFISTILKYWFENFQRQEDHELFAVLLLAQTFQFQTQYPYTIRNLLKRRAKVINMTITVRLKVKEKLTFNMQIFLLLTLVQSNFQKYFGCLMMIASKIVMDQIKIIN